MWHQLVFPFFVDGATPPTPPKSTCSSQSPCTCFALALHGRVPVNDNAVRSRNDNEAAEDET